MNQTTPIKLKTADVLIESMDGVRVIHATGDENEDASSLVNATDTIETMLFHHEEGIWKVIHTHGSPRLEESETWGVTCDLAVNSG